MSGLRGDPVVPGTVNGEARDKSLFSVSLSSLRALSATWRATAADGGERVNAGDFVRLVNQTLVSCADDLDAALGSPTAQEGTPSALHTASRKGE